MEHRLSVPAFRGRLPLSLGLLQAFAGVVSAGSDVGRQSIHQARQAADAQYVVMPVKYNLTILGQLDGNLYADVLFGPNSQTITLGMNTDSVTWVPEQPASKAEFCSNATNTAGCRIAGSVSGYYTPPSSVSKKSNFWYLLDSDYPGYNATGYWSENTVTIGNIGVDLQFGVAESWNIIPSLGLGLWTTPRDIASGRPSYLAALEQQGKIAAQYLSCYDLTDGTDSGSIVIGGVDLDKFSGQFTIWSNFDLPGIVTTPAARVLLGSNITTIPDSKIALTLVNPFTPFLWLPDDLLNALVEVLGATLISTIGAYGIPCNTQIDPTWNIEFTFDKLVITMPMQHLVSTVTSQGNACFLYLQPISQYSITGYNISAILGGPFFRAAYVVVNPSDNTTAIAMANPNVTTEAIVALGGTFGTPLSALVGNAPTPTPSETGSTSANPKKSTPVGAIVGGVVGGIAAIALIIAAIWYFRRKKQQPNAAPPAPPAPDANHPPELPGGGTAVPNHELDSQAIGEVKKAEIQNVQPEYYAELPHKQETERRETYELAG
ncbi:hypothetical protein H072_2617 [Dactylellina haptotyla CBS 200.50]|uniref:Peptidase A1 domain-containing protein n=1 Tax=Dactylellina haptotyla (strain CBS 200.50) TaxID=1284197 RepID=S8AQS9_DACHA|nr:hypothetical protein H072_2617 [Dactylellina haptotyla CBS 200.50]